MKFLTLTLLTVSTASAFAPVLKPSASTTVFADVAESPSSDATPDSSFGKSDLEEMAAKLNPIVKFYDPLDLSGANFWADTNEATIGWLRQSEIKHSRVAMAAFVGYCVQSNVHFPWKMTLEGDDFPSTDLSPEAQWDAIPENAKWQILIVIGFLEFWGEQNTEDNAHYMRGGKPGVFPSFDLFRETVHPMPFDLFDPFRFSARASEEKKTAGLIKEINNGRLAMLGIFGFISADHVEGSVPLLKNIAIPYDGEVMAFF